ncbi:unnamed protein product [Rotaria socialis]|nr:unnamed protein product [Rotaria socialis]
MSEIYQRICEPDTNYSKTFEKSVSEYLKTVDEFESTYEPGNAIEWYTRHTFIFKLVNYSLRKQVVNYIVKMGFFIHDLHMQIHKLYNEQYHNKKAKEFKVYRGQAVDEETFKKMNKDALMGFNGFLSTTRAIDVARDFVSHARNKIGKKTILFTIDMDSSEPMTPFAEVEHISCFPEEKEILFSMHAVFRIIDKKIDDNKEIWSITLKPTSDRDPQLIALANRIRFETQGETEQYRLGVLLIKLGEFKQAEEVFYALREYVSNEYEEALLYFHLGNIKYNQHQCDEALEIYKKVRDFYIKNPYAKEHNLASTFNNMGLIYDRKHDYQEAK